MKLFRGWEDDVWKDVVYICEDVIDWFDLVLYKTLMDCTEVLYRHLDRASSATMTSENPSLSWKNIRVPTIDSIPVMTRNSLDYSR